MTHTLDSLICALQELRKVTPGETPVFGLKLRRIVDTMVVNLMRNDSFGMPYGQGVVLVQSADDMSEEAARKLAAEIDSWIEQELGGSTSR